MGIVKRIVSFLPWLIVFEGVSMAIGYFASPNPDNTQIQNWYAGLIKSPLNPPAFVFPIMWTLLYGLIAYALWRVWQRRGFTVKSFWAFAAGHMILNWGWSFAFFASQNALLGFVWLLAVWLSGIALALWIRRYDRIAALYCVPYILWLTFAAYLNGFIVWANSVI